jgi:G2/mitotic-specific cyclin-B, other
LLDAHCFYSDAYESQGGWCDCPFRSLEHDCAAHVGVKDNTKLCNYATYLVELALVEYGMLKYSYSLIAASAVFVACKAVGKVPAYSYPLQKHSGFSEAAVRPCACAMTRLHEKAGIASLVAVYKKYSNTKFNEVAKSVEVPTAILSEVSADA